MSDDDEGENQNVVGISQKFERDWIIIKRDSRMSAQKVQKGKKKNKRIRKWKEYEQKFGYWFCLPAPRKYNEILSMSERQFENSLNAESIEFW